MSNTPSTNPTAASAISPTTATFAYRTLVARLASCAAVVSAFAGYALYGMIRDHVQLAVAGVFLMGATASNVLLWMLMIGPIGATLLCLRPVLHLAFTPNEIVVDDDAIRSPGVVRRAELPLSSITSMSIRPVGKRKSGLAITTTSDTQMFIREFFADPADFERLRDSVASRISPTTSNLADRASLS